jgi:hypothetical protein
MGVLTPVLRGRAPADWFVLSGLNPISPRDPRRCLGLRLGCPFGASKTTHLAGGNHREIKAVHGLNSRPFLGAPPSHKPRVLKARWVAAWGFQPQVDAPYISGVLKARRYLAWGFQPRWHDIVNRFDLSPIHRGTTRRMASLNPRTSETQKTRPTCRGRRLRLTAQACLAFFNASVYALGQTEETTQLMCKDLSVQRPVVL